MPSKQYTVNSNVPRYCIPAIAYAGRKVWKFNILLRVNLEAERFHHLNWGRTLIGLPRICWRVQALSDGVLLWLQSDPRSIRPGLAVISLLSAWKGDRSINVLTHAASNDGFLEVDC